MGAIEERLRLVDNFSSPMRRVDAVIRATVTSSERLDRSLTRAMGRSAGATIREIRGMQSSLTETNRLLAEILERQSRQTRETERTESKWKKLLSTIRNAAVVTGGIRLAKSIMNAADQQTTLNARIDRMNDGLQTTQELQRSIYESAQRSRGSYVSTADMVGKFGTLAPDAFGSSQEIVNFAEQINKHLTLSGASGAGGDAAILQLTQALGSGVLRGEELNSVLEQTPTIAQAIARYMGVNVGEMRSMAAEGEITAAVVKNALFSAAEETNREFEKMPMTFAQLWQSGLNAVQQAAMPVLTEIAKGASWIHENWDTVAPVLMGVAAAAGTVAVGFGIQAAAAYIASGGLKTLTASLLACPLTWVALGIGVVIALIYRWIQSVGGISVAWLMAQNYVLSGWSAIQIGFMTGVFAVAGWLDMMNLTFTAVGANMANAAGDMKVNVLTQIEAMVNGAIGLLNDFISSVNKIPGVAIGTIDKVSFAAAAGAQNEADKAARNAELESKRTQFKADEAQRTAQLVRMKADAQASQADRLAKIAAARDAAGAPAGNGLGGNIPSFDDVKGVGKVGSVGKVKSIEGDVNLSDEDLKIYRDLAEQRYMNRIELKTMAPNINVTLPPGAGGNLSAQDVADEIRRMLVGQIQSQTAVSHP